MLNLKEQIYNHLFPNIKTHSYDEVVVRLRGPIMGINQSQILMPIRQTIELGLEKFIRYGVVNELDIMALSQSQLLEIKLLLDI